jgi:hypothetical protein
VEPRRHQRDDREHRDEDLPDHRDGVGIRQPFHAQRVDHDEHQQEPGAGQHAAGSQQAAGLLGEYPGNPLAVDIFAANLLLAVLATRAMFALRRRRGQLGEQIEARDVWALRARAAAIVLIVALSAGLAWVNTTAANYCWVLIPSRNGRGAPVRTPRVIRRPARNTPPVISHRPGRNDGRAPALVRLAR